MTIAMLHKWSRDSDGLYSIEDIPAYFTNMRNGREHDAAFLRKIVQNTNESDRVRGEPKLYIHHPHKKCGPAIGKGCNLRVVGETIMAGIRRVRPAVMREIRLGAYPQISIDLDPNTLDVIEGMALCGSEQSYFSVSPIEFEMNDQEKAMLDNDVANDVSFHFDRDESEGKKTGSFMMGPEDAAQIQEIVSQQLTPIKEQLSMMTVRMEAIEVEKATDETTAGRAAEEGAEEAAAAAVGAEVDEKAAEEKKAAMECGTPAEKKEDAAMQEPGEGAPPEKEEPSEEKEAAMEAPVGEIDKKKDLDSFARTVKLEAENAKLKSDFTRVEMIKKCASFIDARMYGDSATLAENVADQILAFPTGQREDALAIAKSSYERIGAPKGKLPDTITGAPDGSDAGAYWDAHFERTNMHYGSMSRDEFIAYVKKNPEETTFIR